MDTATPDPLIGTLVSGRYRVKRLLGEGGMGQVFLAEHEAIEKGVALKVLKPEYSTRPDIVTRFQQEAISASRIKHPNVLDVFDFGQLDNGAFFLAMELLEGHDLAEELERSKALTPERGLAIAMQICRALGAAHGKGVVHRDMKPENVFLQRTADGEEVCKIVDFGIAQLRTTEEAAQSEPKRRRLTKTGMIFGTPEYMSPEQAAGRKADLRVDIYAVGVILYEMFTGAVPHTGETFMAVLSAALSDPVPPMRQVAPECPVSPELEAVIRRALEKRPEDRFESMGALAAALQATPEGQGLGPYTRLSFAELGARQSQTPPPLPNNPTTAQFVPGAVSAGTLAAPVGARTGVGTQVSGTTAEGSANTQPVPAAGGKGVAVGGGLVALAAVAAGAWFLFGRGPAPAPAAATPAALTAAAPEVAAAGSVALANGAPPVAAPGASAPGQPTGATAPPPDGSAVPVASAATPAGKVKLQVVTEPAGAVVSKNGFQVCDTTPCEVLVPLDDELELEAALGKQRGKAKVLASRDQKVTIKLAAPAGGGGRPSGGGGPRMCEVDVDGLKILRPCP